MSERKIKVDVDSGSSSIGGVILAIVVIVLFFGDTPSIADSLRVMAAKMAGIDPFPVEQTEAAP